jgi:hypothetical protein
MNYVSPPVKVDLDASHKRTYKSYNNDLTNGNQLTQWTSEANNVCFSINCQLFRNKIFRNIFRHHLANHIARSSISSRNETF